MGMRTQRLAAKRYSPVELLLGSATGIGWRAQDLWSGQLVMIARVPASNLAGQELLCAWDEIAGEARVVADLRHDRLAKVLDVVLDAGTCPRVIWRYREGVAGDGFGPLFPCPAAAPTSHAAHGNGHPVFRDCRPAHRSIPNNRFGLHRPRHADGSDSPAHK